MVIWHELNCWPDAPREGSRLCHVTTSGLGQASLWSRLPQDTSLSLVFPDASCYTMFCGSIGRSSISHRGDNSLLLPHNSPRTWNRPFLSSLSIFHRVQLAQVSLLTFDRSYPNTAVLEVEMAASVRRRWRRKPMKRKICADSGGRGNVAGFFFSGCEITWWARIIFRYFFCRVPHCEQSGEHLPGADMNRRTWTASHK